MNCIKDNIKKKTILIRPVHTLGTKSGLCNLEAKKTHCSTLLEH